MAVLSVAILLAIVVCARAGGANNGDAVQKPCVPEIADYLIAPIGALRASAALVGDYGDCPQGSSFSYSIFWGDGKFTAELPVAIASQVLHTYEKKGEYRIRVLLCRRDTIFECSKAVVEEVDVF